MTPHLDNKQHWQSLGSSYSDSWEPPAKQALSRRELTFIVAQLRRSAARIALDVGIGNGRILDGLLTATDTTRFYGIDLAEEMVRVCRERFSAESRIERLIVTDISQLRIPIETDFDFISAIRVLPYSANWGEIVGYLVSRLRPGGVLVFSMSNRNSLNRISRPYAVRWYSASRAQLQALLPQAGARIVDMIGSVRLPHFLYDRTRQPSLARLITGTDDLLDRLLPEQLLARELLIAATPSTPPPAASP
ncbi:MAG: class I SAM-dependent methyltransferase [Solirubrobacteraceae bacterium]